MTVYFDKARDRWRFNFRRGGKRHQGYCLRADGTPVANKREALEAEGVEKRKAAIAPKLVRAGDVTLADVFADLSELWRHQDDWPNKRRYMRELLGFFGAATPIAAIDAAQVKRYVGFALAQKRRIWTGGPKRTPDAPENDRFWKTIDQPRGPATINLYLGLLRQAFGHAHEMRDPVTRRRVLDDRPAVPDQPVPKRKARPVPDPVLSDLFGIVPRHVAEAMEATLHFGFRRSEAFGLRIHQVDFQRGGVWLDAMEVKDGEDAFCRGSASAMAFLRRLVDQARERGSPYLITWRRAERTAAGEPIPWRPIRRPKRAWATAMNAIEKTFGRRWRWHDIRAAFITQVAINAGAIAAQRMARHSDFKTTQGYIDVADDILRAAADAASQRPALRVVAGKLLTEIANEGETDDK